MEARGTYTGLIEVATEALFALDLHGVVLSWNAGAERLYGFSPAEAIGRPIADLIVPTGERAAFEGMLRDVQRGPVEVVTTRHTKHGDSLHVLISMSWITTDSGMGYVGVSASDVTDQTEIGEVRRVRSEFLANMSHELRTPLNSIIGFAELMHKGKVGPMAAEHVEFLGDIVTSARRLLGLVNDVFDLARFDAGTITLDPVDLDVAEIASDLREVLKGALAAKHLTLVDTISEGCEQVRADPVRVKQMLYAFIEYAAKATRAKGSIVLRCGPGVAPHEVRLEVEGGGARLTDSELRKVFLEFHKQNVGLGLALARRIAEAHGGRVDVETTDHGTTLIAVLPR